MVYLGSQVLGFPAAVVTQLDAWAQGCAMVLAHHVEHFVVKPAVRQSCHPLRPQRPRPMRPGGGYCAARTARIAAQAHQYKPLPRPLQPKCVHLCTRTPGMDASVSTRFRFGSRWILVVLDKYLSIDLS